MYVYVWYACWSIQDESRVQTCESQFSPSITGSGCQTDVSRFAPPAESSHQPVTLFLVLGYLNTWEQIKGYSKSRQWKVLFSSVTVLWVRHETRVHCWLKCCYGCYGCILTLVMGGPQASFEEVGCGVAEGKPGLVWIGLELLQDELKRVSEDFFNVFKQYKPMWPESIVIVC